jgi:hypothetical protein
MQQVARIEGRMNVAMPWGNSILLIEDQWVSIEKNGGWYVVREGRETYKTRSVSYQVLFQGSV